jgi:hypothetical protein
MSLFAVSSKKEAEDSDDDLAPSALNSITEQIAKQQALETAFGKKFAEVKDISKDDPARKTERKKKKKELENLQASVVSTRSESSAVVKKAAGGAPLGDFVVSASFGWL